MSFETALDITQTPSQNQDERTLPISLIVLHYTGMEDGPTALARMRNPEAKVSAHYMVEENGDIFQLVHEARRAWHAGLSHWAGIDNVNSASIGIEIVNGGHDYGLPDFAEKQIKSVMALCQDIMVRQNIGASQIVGHSDIAPTRKEDPGEKFPWARLAARGIGLWPKNITRDRRILFDLGARDRGISIAQSGLAHIGYGAQVTGVFDAHTASIIKALQRRYRPDQLDGVIDMQTMSIITQLVDQMR